jgi:hypothetical protein
VVDDEATVTVDPHDAGRRLVGCGDGVEQGADTVVPAEGDERVERVEIRQRRSSFREVVPGERGRRTRAA